MTTKIENRKYYYCICYDRLRATFWYYDYKKWQQNFNMKPIIFHLHLLYRTLQQCQTLKPEKIEHIKLQEWVPCTEYICTNMFSHNSTQMQWNAVSDYFSTNHVPFSIKRMGTFWNFFSPIVNSTNCAIFKKKSSQNFQYHKIEKMRGVSHCGLAIYIKK
jgi:hypothetical protein